MNSNRGWLPVLCGVSILCAIFAGVLPMAGCGSNVSSAGTATPANPGNTVPSAVTLYPNTASVSVNQTVKFQAFLPSVTTGTFTWAITGGSANGSISSAGVYTAPAAVPSPSTVTITATSSSNSSLAGTATVNIAAAQGILLTPAAVAVPSGNTQSFSASINGSAATAQWEVNGTIGGDNIHGTIDANGNYTAPLTPPPNGSTTITALSGNSSGTASVAVLFSNNSFNGPYAFSYTGDDGSGFLAEAGSFTAQGSAGQIAKGVENRISSDTGASSATVTFTGTFSINPDGTGTATLSTGTSLQMTLVSNQFGRPAQQAPIIRFDKNGTGSGTLNAQSPGFFSASFLSGNYVFGASGLDPHGAAIGIAGRFFADGISTIPLNSAEEDINYAGVTTLTTVDTSLQGSFVFDPTYGGSNGRGTLTLTTTDSAVLVNTSTSFQFAFYMIDNTHAKLIEIDNSFAMSGDFYSGANTANIGSFTAATSLPGGRYAFTLGGVTNNTGPYSAGGVLSAINSSVSGVGDIVSSANTQLNSTISGGFTSDTGFGRINVPLNFTGAGTLGTSNTTINLAGYRGAYTTPAGQQVALIELIELDGNQVASGIAYPQSTSSSLAGNYALDLSGVSSVKSNPVEDDVVGQLNAANGSFSGNLSFNDFAHATITPYAPLTTGTTIVTAPDANGRGTFALKTSVSNNASFSIAYYNSDNGILLLDTDGGRIAIGTLFKQF